jgi:polar amino acid transport system substrate-binding protein
MKARRWRRGALLGLVMAVAMVAAGCGDDGGDTAGGGGTETTVAAPAVDEALAAKVPDEIKSDGKILVGINAEYAPNEFLDTDGKTVVGWNVDLFNAVAAKLGLQTQYQPSKFADIIPGLQSGKYEFGVSSFTINDERKQQVNMVSYFNAGTQWGTKTGNPTGIQPDNACGKKVAVQTATVQETEDLPQRTKDCEAAGKPAITVGSYQDQGQATAAVVSGKEDAMLADSPVVAYAVKQTNGQLELLGDIYDAAPYGYVVKKDQTEFAQATADAVKALITDGTYKTILEKWGVQAGAIDNPAVNP